MKDEKDILIKELRERIVILETIEKRALKFIRKLEQTLCEEKYYIFEEEANVD